MSKTREYLAMLEEGPNEPLFKPLEEEPIKPSVENGTRFFLAFVNAGYRAGFRAGQRAEPPILIDYPEAARLLGISTEALKKRVRRGLVRAVVRTGRRVQFRKDKL